MSKYFSSLLASLMLLCGFQSAGAYSPPEIPADFHGDEFVVLSDPSDAYCIYLDVKVPTLNSNGDPLAKPVTKISVGEVLTNGWMENYEIFDYEDAEEVLTPGSTVRFTVNHASDGLHTYYAVASTADGSNKFCIRDIFVGYDKPGMVTNLKAEVADDGIRVTWDAPAKGQVGGSQGPVESLSYVVLRGQSSGDVYADTLVTDLHELTFFDQPDFESERSFCYIVYAVNPYGQGFAAASNRVTYGPAASLPFSEDFDLVVDQYGSVMSRYSWTKSYEGGYMNAWQVDVECEINERVFTPHSGNGMLYAYNQPVLNLNQINYFTSCTINFSGATHPLLTFWLYEMTHCADNAKVILRVETSVDGEVFEPACSVEVGKFAAEGWTQVQVPLSCLASLSAAKIRFACEAHGKGCTPVLIDDIVIADDLSSAASLPSSDGSSTPCFNLNGQPVSPASPGLLIRNHTIVLQK